MALWHEHWDHALLLTPTRKMARQREQEYLCKYQLPGIWGRHAFELSQFVAKILQDSEVQVQMVSDLDRRLLVEQSLRHVFSREKNLSVEITPGLIAHTTAFITQLKQAAIDPQVFRKKCIIDSKAQVLERLVADTYEEYQRALFDGGLYDVPGLYWKAEEMCGAGTLKFPHGLAMLLLDGFDDFTPSQQRFLNAVARYEYITHLVIGINYDSDPDRSDLFFLQQQWVKRFLSQFNATFVSCPTYEPKTSTQYAAAKLFWRNPPEKKQDLAKNLSVIPCADIQHEIETIGRKVKHLIVHEGLSPDFIAIALADFNQNKNLLDSILKGFGIPVRYESAPYLIDHGAAVTLLRLFELFGNWQRSTLLALLSSPWIFPQENPTLLMALPLAAREARVTSGRESWFLAVQILKETLTNGGKHSLPLALTKEVLESFLHRITAFAALEDVLPQQGTLGEFSDFCYHCISCLGMADLSEKQSIGIGGIVALGKLFRQMAKGPIGSSTVTQSEFVQIVRDTMGQTLMPMPETRGPSVLCCSLAGLRNERFSHVFVGGLNQGLIPKPFPLNVLYAEFDLHRLHQEHPGLASHRDHAYRERLLFYHALCAAETHWCGTWRKQDKSGRDILPSPFLVEMAELFGGEEALSAPSPGPDCFVPDPLEIASAQDLASTTAYNNLETIDSMFPEIILPVKRVQSIELIRSDKMPFSIYDGVVHSNDLLSHLGKEFGEHYPFSVATIEQYLEFPFHFFLFRVLKLRETDVPDEDLDSRIRGIVLHEILHAFHLHYKGQPVSEIFNENEVAARTTMRAIVEQVFDRFHGSLKNIPETVMFIEKERFARALDRYLTLESQSEVPFCPVGFEVAFGKSLESPEDSLSTPNPFQLVFDDQRYLFSGKIDRIDVSGNNVRIVDYKTSSVPQKKHILKGLSIQLSVYAWAVEKIILPGKTVTEALYVPIFNTQRREALFKNDEGDNLQREQSAIKNIVEAISGIREGRFPPVPHVALNRSEVRAHPAARFEVWRILRKLPELELEQSADLSE